MKTYILDNGFSICLVPVTDAKIVSMRLIVKTGMAYEKKETLGYSHMLEHILLDSNPKYPGTKGLEMLESKGIDMNASTGPTLVDYRLTGGAKHWSTILDFLYYPLVYPKFTKRVFNREKKAIMEELKNHLDDKLRAYKDKIMDTLYKGSVLACSVTDTIASTKACTLKDIKKFYKEQYAPENVTLLVVGKFPINKLEPKLNRFEKFNRDDECFRLSGLDCPDISVEGPGRSIYVPSPNVSKVYCDIIFHLSIEAFGEDYYTGKVVEYILTNGFLSVLYKKLRLDKNWIYHMDSELTVTCYDSDFIIKFNTDAKNFKNCCKEIFKSLCQLSSSVSRKTFAMAKEKIQTDKAKTITNNKISQTNNYISEQIEAGVKPTSIEIFYNNLLKVKSGDVRRFISKYLEKSNATIFYGCSKNPMITRKSRKK